MPVLAASFVVIFCNCKWSKAFCERKNYWKISSAQTVFFLSINFLKKRQTVFLKNSRNRASVKDVEQAKPLGKNDSLFVWSSLWYWALPCIAASFWTVCNKTSCSEWKIVSQLNFRCLIYKSARFREKHTFVFRDLKWRKFSKILEPRITSLGFQFSLIWLLY